MCGRSFVILPVHLYSLWIRRISLALSPVFFHIGPITTPAFLACNVGDTPSCKKLESDEIRNVIRLDDRTVLNGKGKGAVVTAINYVPWRWGIRGSGVIAPLILTFGTRLRWLFSFTICFNVGKRILVGIEYEARWNPQRMWTLRRRRHFFPLLRVDPRSVGCLVLNLITTPSELTLFLYRVLTQYEY